MTNTDNTILFPSYFPDGRPVPDLLTVEEAIKFLRLDTAGPVKSGQTTLQYYRSKGFLRATRVGKQLRYQRKELLKFLDLLTERTQKDVI
jgi:hypothetical protein